MNTAFVSLQIVSSGWGESGVAVVAEEVSPYANAACLAAVAWPCTAAEQGRERSNNVAHHHNPKAQCGACASGGRLSFFAWCFFLVGLIGCAIGWAMLPAILTPFFGNARALLPAFGEPFALVFCWLLVCRVGWWPGRWIVWRCWCGSVGCFRFFFQFYRGLRLLVGGQIDIHPGNKPKARLKLEPRKLPNFFNHNHRVPLPHIADDAGRVAGTVVDGSVVVPNEHGVGYRLG